MLARRAEPVALAILAMADVHGPRLNLRLVGGNRAAVTTSFYFYVQSRSATYLHLRPHASLPVDVGTRVRMSASHE